MGTDNLVFLEVLEWFDETGDTLVHRLPEKGSGEIKFGAQLTVRENQAAVFFYQGRAVEAFGPGRHTLKTANIPILTKLASLPWAMTSPLRAEVYFVNLKIFTDLKWGTRDPVAFRDTELGLIRLRAFGIFNLQVVQPLLFINSLVGTQQMFDTQDIEEYLNRVIVSRFNDYLGKTIDTIFNLPAKYEALSFGLARRLEKDFSQFGLGLTNLYVNSITPPPEVQKAIDDRSRMGVFEGDMSKLMQMKAAMAMEKASEGDGGAGEGMGAGIGLMLPAMFAQYFTGAKPGGPPPKGDVKTTCQECAKEIQTDAKFCPYCGHQQVIFVKCAGCGKNMTPTAKFCSRCGRPAEAPPTVLFCPKCGAENIPDALFCNACGEKIGDAADD